MRERDAQTLYERGIPRLRHHHGRRETELLTGYGVVALHSAGAVNRLRSGSGDARRARHFEQSVRAEPLLFRERHLIEKIFPLRVVVFEIDEHRKRKLALGSGHRAVYRHFVALFYLRLMTVLHIAHHGLVGAFETDCGRRIRSVPVRTGEVRYALIVLGTLIKVEVSVGQPVFDLYFFLRFFGYGVNLGIRSGDVYLIYVSRIARAVHARFLLVRRLYGKHVVERVVRVRAEREVIVAPFENIRSLAVSVVGAHIFLVHGHRNGLIRAGGENARLGKADKLYRGHFHARAPRVRTLHVYLHDVLARISRARVGNGYRNGYRLVRLGERNVRIGELRIAEPVAERERDFLRVVPAVAVRRARIAAGARRAENVVLVTSFVVAVADVHALLIHHVFEVVRLVILAVFLAYVGHVAILRPRIVAEIGI